MAHGITVLNATGELVMSEEAILASYLGMATHVSTTQPVGVGGSTGTGTAGSSLFQYTWAGVILPVIALPTGFKGTVLSCTQSGTTWSIRVSYTDGTEETDINEPTFAMYFQSVPEIFVFGYPTSLAGTVGAAIYNGSGQLVADLTRRPLFIKKRVEMSAGSTSTTIPALTKPGVIGRATDTTITGGPSGVPELTRVLYQGCLFDVIDSGTTLRKQFERRKLQNIDNFGGDISARRDACTLWLIECAGLT